MARQIVKIAREIITRGASFKPIFVVQNSSRVAIDLTTATYVTWLSIRPQGSTAAATEKSTADGDEYDWVTDGTDGQIQFLFSVADTLALTEGEYDVEIFWSDTSATPDDQVPKGRGIWTVEDPSTTTLTAPA
jgi:hypothetical protein